VKQFIYNPSLHGNRMTIVCFVSGSGTNYERIVARDPNHDYVVFTNRPGCGGAQLATKNKHPVIELSHASYLRDARKKYGPGNVPRNCPEREKYEQDIWSLIEARIHKEPDLICLAGYDQWTTDWMVNRFYPRLLNVHPGDTTKGYDGLHWVPTAKAILAGDEGIRSTLFLVDKGKDTGPVLVQSKSLNIVRALGAKESEGAKGLLADFHKVVDYAKRQAITSYERFNDLAGIEGKETIKQVCVALMGKLKIEGDWEIYPFAVHDLIAHGRVEIDDRTIFIDGRQLPEYGYRLDEKLSG
jgi:folate-dependent phosphoribosylglycinamide formyltransferase PurN